MPLIKLHFHLAQIAPGVQHITLVITPLKSLMADHMKRWTEKGVKVAVISGDSRDKAGNYI